MSLGLLALVFNYFFTYNENMKNIFTVLILLGCLPLLQAKTPVKATRQIVKGLTTSSTVKTGTLAPYSGARGAVMGVNYHLQQPLPQATLSTTQRPWLKQQQRNWKAYQLHKTRQARDIELQIQAQETAAREAMLAKLPQANPAHQFMTKDFVNLLPTQVFAEELPLVAQPHVLYRGLALPADGKAIENILQNGLRVADVGKQANTRNLAMSGGMPGTGRALAKTPVTNLTSFPTDAAKWAVKRLSDQKPLVTIVAVNGQTQSGQVVLAAQDIPASAITHLFTPLLVNGTSVWCKVELAPDGDFLVTPYDIVPAAQ